MTTGMAPHSAKKQQYKHNNSTTYSSDYPGQLQNKRQNSASLALCKRNHQWLVESTDKSQ